MDLESLTNVDNLESDAKLNYYYFLLMYLINIESNNSNKEKLGVYMNHINDLYSLTNSLMFDRDDVINSFKNYIKEIRNKNYKTYYQLKYVSVIADVNNLLFSNSNFFNKEILNHLKDKMKKIDNSNMNIKLKTEYVEDIKNYLLNNIKEKSVILTTKFQAKAISINLFINELNEKYNYFVNKLYENKYFLDKPVEYYQKELKKYYEYSKKTRDNTKLNEYITELLMVLNNCNYRLKVDMKFDDGKVYNEELEKFTNSVNDLKLMKYFLKDKNKIEIVEVSYNTLCNIIKELKEKLDNGLITYAAAIYEIYRNNKELNHFKENINNNKNNPIAYKKYLYFNNYNDYADVLLNPYENILYTSIHDDSFHSHKIRSYSSIEKTTTSECHIDEKHKKLSVDGIYEQNDGALIPPMVYDIQTYTDSCNRNVTLFWNKRIAKVYRDGKLIGYAYYDVDTNSIKGADININQEKIEKTYRLR